MLIGTKLVEQSDLSRATLKYVAVILLDHYRELMHLIANEGEGSLLCIGTSNQWIQSIDHPGHIRKERFKILLRLGETHDDQES